MDITFSAGQTENKTTVAEYKNMAHIYTYLLTPWSRVLLEKKFVILENVTL